MCVSHLVLMCSTKDLQGSENEQNVCRKVKVFYRVCASVYEYINTDLCIL